MPTEASGASEKQLVERYNRKQQIVSNHRKKSRMEASTLQTNVEVVGSGGSGNSKSSGTSRSTEQHVMVMVSALCTC